MLKLFQNQVRRVKEKLRAKKLEHYRQKYDLTPPNITDKKWEDIKSIALLRWDNKLGDSIMSGAFIASIQKYRPDISITIITQPFCADWFNGVFPHCNIILCNEKSLKTAKSLSRYQGQFDIVIELSTIFTHKELAAIHYLGAPFNLGYKKDEHPIFTHNIDPKFIHFHERYLQAAALFTKEPQQLDSGLPVLDFNHVAPFKFKNGFQHIAINLFGASKHRQFHHPHSITFIQKWLKTFPNDILYLIPVPDKIDELKTLLNEVNNERAKLASDVPSLALTLRLLSQVDLCFTMDTSVVHMASALNTPTLAVFRDDPINIEEWKPISEKSDIIVNNKPEGPYQKVMAHEFLWEDLVSKRKSLNS